MKYWNVVIMRCGIGYSYSVWMLLVGTEALEDIQTLIDQSSAAYLNR